MLHADAGRHDARTARVRLIGLAVALVLEAALVAADIATTGTVIFTSAYLVAPLALALVAGPAIVAVTAGLSIAPALASGLWNDFFLSADHVMRCSIVSLAGLLALLSARGDAGGAGDDRALLAIRDAGSAVGARR